MLTRAYCPKLLKRFPAYKGTTVCEEWLIFTNFKRWMEGKEWDGKDLDKDILDDSKIYSPQTCNFVSRMINTFITPSGKVSNTMIGTYLHKSGKFQSNVGNPFSGKMEYLGLFERELDAHLAWKVRKHELSFKIAETQSNSLITKALTTRYL